LQDFAGGGEFAFANVGKLLIGLGVAAMVAACPGVRQMTLVQPTLV
jgi:hypothetical protein